ncbi:MAG: SH3 domain-containing protein [Aggregatilineales bacterium]
MRRLTPLLLIVFAILTFSNMPEAHAQSDEVDCPILVETALNAADELCRATSRNEACYGNLVINAQTRVPATFETSGDIVQVSNIESLELATMNVARNEWGVALLRVQANLPDTLPGSNVTFLLFSDVVIEDAGYEGDATPPPVLNAVTQENSNVRSGPGTEFFVIDSLTNNEAIIVNGRNEAGDWLRIELPSGVNTGWISASLLDVDGDINELELSGAGSATTRTQFGPMQAFYFRSGIGDAPCNEAPDSGMIIQTPEGAFTVDLQINGVNVELGSTMYLTAGVDENGEVQFNIHMVEGNARIESEGVAQFLRAGQMLQVPLDEDYNPTGQPGIPMPYDGRNVSLPIRLLERATIVIPPAFEPNPNAPVIERISRSRLSTDSTREDIFFTDVNGDATTLNISLIDISNPNINFQFEGSSINIAPEDQQAGATLSRETLCTEGTDGIEALFRISISDSEGLESNIVEYRTTCGG